MSITDLPRELIFQHVLKDVNPGDIENVCQTLPQLRGQCNKEKFWEFMIKLHYPTYMDYKPAHVSWEQYFQGILNGIYILKKFSYRVITFDIDKTIRGLKILIDSRVPYEDFLNTYGCELNLDPKHFVLRRLGFK